MGWIDRIVGDLRDKRRYLAFRARLKALPDGYREAGTALERYLLSLGPSDQGASLIAMLDDLIDLLEQGAADERPLREVVGSDPVEFAETFMENYGGGSWIRKERSRLAASIDDAVQTDAAERGTAT